MAEYFELLKTRRAIRNFEERDLHLDLIQEIIRESCLAPSSMNGQPWRFIIVKDKALIQRLSDESKKNVLRQIQKDPDSPRKKFETALRDKRFNVYHNAPCLIYIVGAKTAHRLQVDCSLAACYFMFSAAARGLGTCWIGLGSNIRDPELLKLIGLPDDFEIVAPLVLGYPKRIPEPTERKDPEIIKIIP